MGVARLKLTLAMSPVGPPFPHYEATFPIVVAIVAAVLAALLLWSGEVVIFTGRRISRVDEPGLYWVLVAGLVALAAWSGVHAASLVGQPSG
jgi:hypothetical protein